MIPKKIASSIIILLVVKLKSMSKLKEILFSSRVKSFIWRTSMMVIAVIVGSFSSNIDLIAPYVSVGTVTVLGLILGEVSKAINNRLQS